MEVHRLNFQEKLPELMKLLEEAEFISFDFEYSGILNDFNKRKTPGKPEICRKPTLEERYQSCKESAEKYCILQMGICPVVWDTTLNRYTGQPFNFYVNPIVNGGLLRIDRVFSCTSDAMKFHLKNGFDFNKLYGMGVSYLSRAEETGLKEKWVLETGDQKSEINVDDAEIATLQMCREQIQIWEALPDKPDFLNVAPKHRDQNFNGYQKRLLHQMLGKEYPHLAGRSYDSHFQVRVKDEKYEEERKKGRGNNFNALIDETRGVRLLIDKIMECKRPIVGHNCFQDLLYLYRTFIGDLPPTLTEWRKLLRTEFGMIVDTKFLALNVDQNRYGEITSCLQNISHKLLKQDLPRLELHVRNSSYGMSTFNHEAGYDSWSTARVFVKLAFRMYVAGSDTPTFPNSITPDIEERVKEIEEALSVRPKAAGLAAMVAFEKTPTKARIPTWTSRFWQVYGRRLRVNGTIEGEFMI